MIQWRLQVYDQAGTLRDTYTQASGEIADFAKVSVASSGNCLEMEFQARPKGFSGIARDRVVLAISSDSGATYQNLFHGIITTAGDPRADTLRTYRAVGLYKRLEETAIPTDFGIVGDDVAAMVGDAFEDITVPGDLPDGIIYSGAPPTLGFDLGTRYFAYEFAGVFLDALRDTVGAFVVPAGSSYTYDGITYSAGESVPPTRWGVDADGVFFFRRIQTDPFYLDEKSRRTEVEWTRVNGEDFVDAVAFLYYGNEHPYTFRPPTHLVGPQPANPVVPIVATFQKGADPTAWRRVELENPVDYMVNTGVYAHSSGNLIDEANLDDGDPSTYALVDVDHQFAAESNTNKFLCVMDIEFADPTREVSIYIERQPVSSTFFVFYGRYILVPNDEGAVSGRITLIFPHPGNVRQSSFRHGFSVNLERGDSIHEISFYEPDQDLGTQIAQTYYKEPAIAAAEVHYNGLGPVRRELILSPEDGGVDLTLPIERVEYSITRERGLETTYYVGEAFDADLEAERILITDIAEKVSRG